jgi:adenylate kinase
MAVLAESSCRKNAEREIKAGVYMLMGVNGVGKSTVVEEISASSESTIVIHASEELRGLFGGMSRQELETLRPEVKLGKMVTHFTVLFDRHVNNDKAVLFDTHLLVPIRKGGSVTYENIWSNDYSQYVSDVVMLEADPAVIRKWRLYDREVTGRVRDVSVENIIQDQILNTVEFENLVAKHAIPATSTLLRNEDGDIEQTFTIVKKKFTNIYSRT